MQIVAAYIIHILCNATATFVIYKLMRTFFCGKLKNTKVEIISYISYNILSLFCYYLFGIPLVMLIFNLMYFFLLTLNYKAKLKHRS